MELEKRHVELPVDRVQRASMLQRGLVCLAVVAGLHKDFLETVISSKDSCAWRFIKQ